VSYQLRLDFEGVEFRGYTKSQYLPACCTHELLQLLARCGNARPKKMMNEVDSSSLFKLES
jgi:hypothetical protein